MIQSIEQTNDLSQVLLEAVLVLSLQAADFQKLSTFKRFDSVLLDLLACPVMSEYVRKCINLNRSR